MPVFGCREDSTPRSNEDRARDHQAYYDRAMALSSINPSGYGRQLGVGIRELVKVKTVYVA